MAQSVASLLALPALGGRDRGRAASPDDTFACLAENGREIIALERDHGYERFHHTRAGGQRGLRRPRRDLAVPDLPDARAELSDQHQRRRPQRLLDRRRGAGDQFRDGGLARDLQRRERLGFNFGDGQSTEGFTLDGIRIDNVWDGIRPRGNADGFRITNVWVSGARDDCIENDHRQTGVIEDSLFDRCHMGISVRPGKSGKEKARAQEQGPKGPLPRISGSSRSATA